MKNVDAIELNYSITIKKHPNSGIEILKTILTFLILVYHCSDKDLSDNKIIVAFMEIFPFYFPTYFLINFYFSYFIFSSRNITRIKLRFTRLVIPYIIWPFIFLSIKVLTYKKNIPINKITYDSFSQLIIGRGIYFVFWYQFNMIFIFLIFSIIILSFKKYHLYIFQTLLIISYILEFFGFTEKFFGDYSEDIRRSIGRTIKMLIFSILGFLLSSVKMLNFFKRYKTKSICFSFTSLVFIIYYKVYFLKFYCFEGIFLALGAICLLIFFALLPLDNLTNMTIIFLIKQMTSYTAGVYFIHVKIMQIFNNSITIFRTGEIRGCVLNYLICHSICFVGMKLFGKSKLKYLFI